MISIIIPVFNGAKYIEKCYESLLNQTYSDFEIVFVNDGSTDNSSSILNKLADNDDRIKVITQENKGVIFAREKGIKESTGSYVLFLDIDDTLPDDTLAIYNSCLPNNAIDIFIGSMNLLIDSRSRVRENKKSNGEVIDSLEYTKQLLVSGGWELCGKLYKKELFDQEIIYPHLRIGEDAAILFQLVMRAEKISFLNKNLYSYIINTTSASNIQSSEYAEEGLRAAVFIEGLLQDKHLMSEIDAMHLLFFSNSLRRGILTKKSPLVRKLNKNITFKALNHIGFTKSIYILLSYYGGRYFQLFFRKLLI